MALVLYAILVILTYGRTAAGLIAFAQLVVGKMTGNANFPNAATTLSATSAAIAAYQAALSSSGTTKGLKGLRVTTKGALVGLLQQLRDMVRVVAMASPENALAIVESAGMVLKRRGSAIKALISVVQGALSGSALCVAKVPFRGVPTTYFWSYSLDQKVWTNAPRGGAVQDHDRGAHRGADVLLPLLHGHPQGHERPLPGLQLPGEVTQPRPGEGGRRITRRRRRPRPARSRPSSPRPRGSTVPSHALSTRGFRASMTPFVSSGSSRSRSRRPPLRRCSWRGRCRSRGTR